MPRPFYLSEPVLSGHLEGFALRFGGEVAGVYPTDRDAEAGLKAARQALSDLADLLARKEG